MSPISRRAATTLAAIATMSLALAACSPTGDGPAPQESESEAAAPAISVPSTFDAQSASWTISDLPGGSATKTVTSHDGKYLAYGYSTQEGGKYNVGQINLASGEKAEEASTDLLEADDPNNGSSLIYSGNKLILTQAGTTPGEGAEQATDVWKATIFDAGNNHKAPKEITEELRTGAGPTLPSSASGPIVSLEDTHYVINASKGSFSEVSSTDTESLKGCGGPDCNLPLTPIAQQNGTTVSSFQEIGTPGHGCSETDGPDDGCLVGFTTGKWTSQDIAPKGALKNKASLVATGNGYLVGAWATKAGGTIFRTIKTSSPDSAHAVVKCDSKLALNTSPKTLRLSPSGKYAVTHSIVFDLKDYEGYCFDESNGKNETLFTAVDDSGTAWGAMDSAWSGNTYAQKAVTATADGKSKTVTPSSGDSAALPQAFVHSGAQTFGVFAVADEVADAPDSTVVAAYPSGS